MIEQQLESCRAHLADLIAFATVSTDSNLALIAHVESYLTGLGARVEVWRDVSGQKANLFATFGPEGDGGLMLSGHSDVVPVTDQVWSSDPFEMVEREGNLYGRGTCDMKGFIAACLAIAPRLADTQLTRPVHIALTYDEETACLGGQALVESLRQHGLHPALAIVGEPTLMGIVEGHKGCCEYSVQFHGAEGHGSSPDLGVNAVEYASRYIGKLLELKEALRARAPQESRFEPPWTTINVGACHGGVVHNVIPGLAQVDWEMRPVQAGDADFVKGELARYCQDQLLPAMQAVAPKADITTKIIGEVAGLEVMEENAARDLMRELTGQNHTAVVPFGTEAGLYQELGMDVVVCGPGSIAQAHKPDEFIALSQLQLCLEVLHKLVDQLSEPT